MEVASAVAFSVLPPLMLKSGFRESAMSTLFGVGERAALFIYMATKVVGDKPPLLLILRIAILVHTGGNPIY